MLPAEEIREIHKTFEYGVNWAQNLKLIHYIYRQWNPKYIQAHFPTKIPAFRPTKIQVWEVSPTN